MWQGPTTRPLPTWHAALHRGSTQRIEKGLSEGHKKWGPGKGETLCLEYMEIKAKSSLARDFAHDQGFAGARGQVEAKL